MKKRTDTEGYTNLPNTVRDNPALCLHAKAALWYYLSHKNIPGFVFRVKSICKFLEIGRPKWLKVSKQLKDCGYLLEHPSQLNFNYPEVLNVTPEVLNVTTGVRKVTGSGSVSDVINETSHLRGQKSDHINNKDLNTTVLKNKDSERENFSFLSEPEKEQLYKSYLEDTKEILLKQNSMGVQGKIIDSEYKSIPEDQIVPEKPKFKHFNEYRKLADESLTEQGDLPIMDNLKKRAERELRVNRLAVKLMTKGQQTEIEIKKECM